MKKSELQAWRDKQPTEVDAELQRLSGRLTGAYLARSANKLQNVSMIRNLRRDIAWLRTVHSEQLAGLAAAKESQS